MRRILTGTIRGRITFWASAVFLLLVALESGLVLGGMQRALDRVAEESLLDKLDELASELADASLVDLLGPEPGARPPWSDFAFEVRDYLDAEAQRRGRGTEWLYEIRRAGGQPVAASMALEGRRFARSGTVHVREGVAFREEADPRPGRGSQRVRLAEIELGPYQLQLARDLSPLLATYAAIRRRILAILIGVPLLAGLGAYLIATRALSPVRRLVDEAQRLRTLSEGTLPRSGAGDEIDDLAAVLNSLLGRVRAEVMRMRQFTADAAHEIRTPLAAIRGHLELLQVRVDPAAQSTLSGVLEEVERLTRLVNQLLLLEKLEGSPEATERRRLDLGALAGDLVEHLGLMAEEQGIELESDLAPTPVNGDREKLRQVFLNILDNAFKHTPRGGRVSLRVLQEGGHVKAIIRDSGPGIPAGERERMFERFASDRSSRAAGTGLGLPIARAIARAHGGDLTVASPGGAQFTLELPPAGRLPGALPVGSTLER